MRCSQGSDASWLVFNLNEKLRLLLLNGWCRLVLAVKVKHLYLSSLHTQLIYPLEYSLALSSNAHNDQTSFSCTLSLHNTILG
ncbi:hypothetical protein Bca101_096416 [Brassica carinata]